MKAAGKRFPVKDLRMPQFSLSARHPVSLKTNRDAPSVGMLGGFSTASSKDPVLSGAGYLSQTVSNAVHGITERQLARNCKLVTTVGSDVRLKSLILK